jgi:hypothetical protein
MTSASFTARDPDGPPPGLNRQRRVTQSTASIWNRSAAAHSPPNIGYVGQGVGVALQKVAWPRGSDQLEDGPLLVRRGVCQVKGNTIPGDQSARDVGRGNISHARAPDSYRRAWPLAGAWTSLQGRPQPVPSGRYSISADPVTRPSEVARLWVCDADVQRSPVRSATRWRRLGSMASARGIAGRMVVSRRASIDFPTPGGPRRTTLWAERRHHVPLHLCPWPRPKRSLLMGIGLAEFAAPRTDRFLGHPDPTCPWPLLTLAATQAEVAQAPYGLTDALGWTLVMYVGGG